MGQKIINSITENYLGELNNCFDSELINQIQKTLRNFIPNVEK